MSGKKQRAGGSASQDESRLRAGQEISGFVVRAVTPVPELRLTAYELEHVRSGARLIHLHAADAENLFSITFSTPPPDDTGVPHIMEHAVLSGSRKFAVRDPFFEMYKMSMATFINAMTGQDATYYPVSSNVRQDLFNLAEVYFDAVFHPLLSEESFRREAHHLTPGEKPESLGVRGIVYNEMKGAYSEPESRLSRHLTHDLAPDTYCGKDSGGDPDRIPDLTYEQFKRFHEAWYHPSNALFVLYGDIATVDYLAFLKDRLDAFERREVRPPLEFQPRWKTPRRHEDTYPIGRTEPLEGKSFLAMGWLTGRVADAPHAVELHVLNRILLGHQAAPLRKALIDSGLGEDLVSSGDTSVGPETSFRVGLRGSEPDRVEAFEKLVLDTLRSISDGDIASEQVESALHQATYYHVEIQQLFPMHVMQRVLTGWLYGPDPLLFLRMREHLEDCRRRWQADPRLFNRLIRELLLDNPHRMTAVLRPDREWQDRADTAFAARMEHVRAELSPERLEAVAPEAAELERTSGTPNSPEALATLPQLSVKDLPPKPRHIPTRVESMGGGAELLRNDVFSNGVCYLELSFDLRGLPEEMWIYLPRYVDAVRKMGAAGQSYEQIARRAAGCTGGLSCHAGFSAGADDPARPVWTVGMGLKTLDEQLPVALDLLQDLVFSIEPRDRDRLRQVIVQARAGFRAGLVGQGTSTARSHAARGLRQAAYLSDLTRGLPQLRLTERLAERFEEEADAVAARVESLREFLLARGRLIASFTGSDAAYARVRSALKEWLGRMRAETPQTAPTEYRPFEGVRREGLAAPIQVSHCARVIPAPHYSDPDEALLTVGAHIAGMDYMLNEIRFKGNAYGAQFNYDPLGGMITLGSYRDPHVTRTLEVFDRVTDWVRQADWSQLDVDRAIIGVAKQDEQPIRPGPATGLALTRHLLRLTPERRDAHAAALRTATPAQVKRALLQALESGAPRAATCVLSSREHLEEANRALKGSEMQIEDIIG